MSRQVSRARRIWARLLTTLAVLAALPAVAATAVRYVPILQAPTTGDQWAIITAVSDLGFAGYALALVFLIIALVLRFGIGRLIVLVLVVAATAVHLSWIMPRFVGDDRPVTGEPRVRVLTQNMNSGRADTAETVAHAQQADIVVLTELTRTSFARLLRAGWHSRFPYEQSGVLTTGAGGGTRVFSRFPIAKTLDVGGALRLPLSLVDVQVPQLGTVQVLAVHPGRPRLDGLLWVEEQEIVRRDAPTSGRAMIVGDFSAVDSQIPLRTLRAQGYRSSTDLAGAGWQPTYPANSRVPALFEIDHVLLSPGLTATASTTLATADTDHRAVLATVAPA